MEGDGLCLFDRAAFVKIRCDAGGAEGNSDYDGREIDTAGVHSGRMIFLQAMIDITAGEDSSAYWDEVRKWYGRSA